MTYEMGSWKIQRVGEKALKSFNEETLYRVMRKEKGNMSVFFREIESTDILPSSSLSLFPSFLSFFSLLLPPLFSLSIGFCDCES